MNPITALLAALAALTAVYVGVWAKVVAAVRGERGAAASPATDARFPTPAALGVGAVTNFFDTLGIGSFATTTAMFRAFKMVPDRIIPGTLNAGHTLPTVTQAFFYISVIPVDVVTLISMIVAAVAGAWLGAGVVAGWSKRNVQIGMGAALLAAAIFFTMRNLGLFPAGSDAIGVTGIKLVIAVAGNFLLGALMSLGIGLYAPCMILVSLLGMSETTAFPIMMGSCAFLMPVGGLKFIRERAYSLRAALGLALGGIPGVIVAATIVKNLNVTTVRWLVIVVVLYTALTMLYAALSDKQKARLSSLPGGIAGILLALGVICVIAAQSIYRRAAQTALFESISQGRSLAIAGDILQWGGIAVAAVGLVLLLRDVLRKPNEGNSN